MRRVIVDQIEALAELNRIVARHGRNMDAAEPAARRATEPVEVPAPPRRETVMANAGGSRAEQPTPGPADITEPGPPPTPPATPPAAPTPPPPAAAPTP